MEARDLAVGTAGARVAIGVASLLAPRLVARTLTRTEGTSLFARMAGARDLGLGLGVLIALDRGAPVRGWLEASALADGVDVAACLLARDDIRRSVLPGVVVLAATGALLSAWLARELDEASPAPAQHA